MAKLEREDGKGEKGFAYLSDFDKWAVQSLYESGHRRIHGRASAVQWDAASTKARHR